MTTLPPSHSENISKLIQFDQTSEFPGILNPGVYEYQEFETNCYFKSGGYPKPKHRWMAKDQSMTVSSPTNNLNYPSSAPCPESSEGQFRIAGFQQLSQTTPNRNGYTGFSPSISSSAAGTVAMPSSLTNTSSSPSNHTPPHSRNGLNIIDGSSPCISPSSESIPPCNRSSVTENGYAYKATVNHLLEIPKIGPQVKRRRGRPPKNLQLQMGISKLQGTKRQPKLSKITKLHPSGAHLSHAEPMYINKTGSSPKIEETSLSNFHEDDIPNVPINPVMGGLKIRLRRDNTANEPICSVKKSRMRKAPSKTAGVFRIVESWCDTDAPGGDLSHRAFAAKSSAVSPSSSVNLSAGSFRVGDVVWAKLAGYPYWPSRISALWARTAHQLAQVSPSPQNADSTSLSVAATPADPSLASGFTAKVEWFAWDQFSYLSCAKLFPFLDSFDKLYNSRTRVKGYADAVRMANAIVSNCEVEDSYAYASKHFPNSTDYLNEAPPTSLLSTFNNSCHSTSVSHTVENDMDIPVHSNPCPLDLSFTFPPDASFGSEAQRSTDHHPYPSDVLHITSNPNELYQDSSCLPDIGTQSWAPLPQLDISGFGDIIPHVPTFSDDEEESLATQLKIQLTPIP